MSTRNRSLFVVAACLSAAVPAAAQITDPATHLASQLPGRAAQISALQQRSRAGDTLTPAETANATISLQRDNDIIFLALIPRVANKAKMMLALEERRADKQLGEAAGSTAGSTSLVSRGGTPAILALAVENGALAQDVSGTTVTFRGTPASIVKTIGNTGYFKTLETTDSAISLLQKLSFAVSFDTSRGAPPGQPAFTAQRGQFSALSVRLSAVDNKDPRAAANDQRWNTFSFTQNDLDQAAVAAFEALKSDPAITEWIVVTQHAIQLAALARIQDVVVAQFDALGSVAITPATQAAVNRAAQQFEGMLKRRAQLLEEIKGGGQLVFDWAYQRPPTGAESSNLKVVGSVGRSVLLTGNGSLTLYHGSLGAGSDRVRDIQAAIQLDIPFGNPDGIGRYVLSFSTKAQHMPNDVDAGDGTLFPGTKGTIWLGQMKLTIPVNGSAAKIPFSLTVANRTELNTETHAFARMNVGFSYDLDTVFARFRP